MLAWKRMLLSAYVAGSMPYRRWAARQAAEAGRAPIVVLFYHRVSDDRPNPWTISRAKFDWQIEWLKANVDVISLAEAQRRMRACDSHRPAACITFDDGYADNCLHALPLLIKERLPVTYFVTSQCVFRSRPFPHDVALGEPFAPNTLDQLRALAAAGVEIGAHTRTHADLGRIDDERRLYDEVIASARELGEAVGRPLRYFAFPYGQRRNLNRAVFRLAREHGFAGVCSAYGGYNLPGDDTFHLQRVHADPEPARFVNCMTIDPRKCCTRRFTYDSGAPSAVGSIAAAHDATADAATADVADSFVSSGAHPVLRREGGDWNAVGPACREGPEAVKGKSNQDHVEAELTFDHTSS